MRGLNTNDHKVCGDTSNRQEEVSMQWGDFNIDNNN